VQMPIIRATTREDYKHSIVLAYTFKI